MRYYDLTISDPTNGQVWHPTPTGLGFTKSLGGTTFTSYVNGYTSPNALNIEFDLPVFPWNKPQGQSIIRVWGVGLGMLAQASNLNFQNFSLSAGMKKGLPLANPAQAGILAQGMVFQAFGNWRGVGQTLDLICSPGAAAPLDITFAWPAGIGLDIAIQSALSHVPRYLNGPSYVLSIQISPNLRQLNFEAGHYDSLQTFADYIQQISAKIGQTIYGASYPGVQITVVGNTIFVTDGTVAPKVTLLAFQDLIGQPTWIEPATISFTTVLRSDLAVQSLIKFPQGVIAPFALTSIAAAAPNAPAGNRTTFQGTFTILDVHHFANFRQPDAESWNTTFTAAATLS